jgi:hypothetical protein
MPVPKNRTRATKAAMHLSFRVWHARCSTKKECYLLFGCAHYKEKPITKAAVDSIARAKRAADFGAFSKAGRDLQPEDISEKNPSAVEAAAQGVSG